MSEHISYSGLKTWKECPYRYKLFYVDGMPKTGGVHASFGKMVHGVLEDLIDDPRWDEADIVTNFDEKYKQELANLEKDGVEHDLELLSEMKNSGPDLCTETITTLNDHFGKYSVVASEEELNEPIEGSEKVFNGFIDLVIQTSDGKYHIVDYKTCSWGWPAEKKTSSLITYQLTLYKHFYALKHSIDPSNVETYFALLKRTAKPGKRVEIFRVTSGPKKTKNALELLRRALYNIKHGRFMKNKLSCNNYCPFNGTEHCKK